MKRVLLYRLDPSTTDQIFQLLGGKDYLIIPLNDQMFEDILQCQAHVVVIGAKDVSTAARIAWAQTRFVNADDFANDPAQLADAIETAAAHTPRPVVTPGSKIFGAGDRKVFGEELPDWNGAQRTKILDFLGVLHATAKMREREIREYLALTARYVEDVERHPTLAKLPAGTRAASLRMCLSRCVGAVALFFPEADPDSLPWPGGEIARRLTVQAFALPGALYALECVKRRLPENVLFEACESALLTLFPFGKNLPWERQEAISVALHRQFLRIACDLRLVLLGGPGIKRREMQKARQRLSATAGICFAGASYEEIEARAESAGPVTGFGFGEFLAGFASKPDADSEVFLDPASC